MLWGTWTLWTMVGKSLTLSSDIYLLCLLSCSQGMKQSSLQIWTPMKCHEDPCLEALLYEWITPRDLFPSFSGIFKRSLNAIKPDDISYGSVLGNTLLETAPRFNGNQCPSGMRVDWARLSPRRRAIHPPESPGTEPSTTLHCAKEKSQPWETELRDEWESLLMPQMLIVQIGY